MKVNCFLKPPSTALLLPNGCRLVPMVMLFPGLLTNKVLMASICLRCLVPVPVQKSSVLCSSMNTDFYFAKQGHHIHPSQWILVFSTPPPPIPKFPVSFTFSLTLIPVKKLSSQHQNVLSFAKPNYFLF